MYLQSLELQGFKSFPDKIKLTFDKGLTAVVGPNGSGKSNIGDAVRWVLGEQSTKTLRGNKMEDVIFSGTKTRKPMGFAAVTLEINNATGELGEEYGAVVSVTRKLYRSGDSEYRINGKSVRLKDVTELFMDTGMGRDGYAIIGQGRIAEIVSAKSTDRRDIFEEAAGVSKFRYKKQEAQRKLDGAQENLVRLLDIVAELEARVEPLRKQAEKAKQYVELAGQQKQLEVSLWVRRLTALREKLTALSDGCLQAQAEYQNAEREVQRADTQVQEGYRKMQESTLHMEELRQKLREADQETANLQSAIAVCENEVVHSEGAIAELERQMALIAEQSEAAENQFLVLQKRQAELEQRQEKLQAQSGEVEQRWKSLEQAAAQQGEACEKSSARMQQLLMQQSELRVMQETAAGQQQELRAQITEHAMRCHALGQAKETQQSACQTAEQQAAQAAETLQQVQNRRDGFQRRYANSVQALENGKKQQEQAAFALREKRQRQKLLQDMERNMEGFAGSVKSVLRADGGKPHGVFGTVAQLITTNSRYGVALETALGGAMQNLVVADENAAKQWIRHLAKNRAGRATFLPLTSVRGRTLTESGLERHEGFIDLACNLVQYDPQYTEIVRFLLGRIAVAEDLDTATALARAYQYRFRIVTLDGQIINAGGSFTGGSAQRSGGMLTRRAELDSLAAAIQTLEEQEAQASAALEKAKQQSRQLQQQMEALQDECRRAESASLAANAQVEKFYYVQQQAAERLEEAQQQHSACQQRLRQTEQSLRTAQEKAVQTAKELEQVQQSIQQEGDKRQALQQQQEELAQQRAELKIQLVSLEKDREQLAESLSQQTQAQHSMEQRLAQTRADIAAQNGKIVQKKQQAQENRARLEQLKTESKTNAEQIQHWQQVHDTQDQNIRQIQAGLREINDSREKISGEISRLEERKIAVQSDYDGVVRQLMEQYELSVSEAQQAAQPLEDLQAAQRELQSLKAKIRALGTVNVAAISEYEEVFARYQFLTAQVQDAQKAKQELEDLIESLTTEMQRIFSESFSIINRNFQEIFRELFGGGEARLELTDPEQVLESGIEIKVAPPGKVIKNLISLSGGEQSFVAIAIYFAILRLRPSPFCILDEIDAALDEGNVRKYAQYLRNFTDTTQFVLVTHRRSAMEEGMCSMA
ncbi:chromosome segregation protein SMC [Ruminococcus sp.]|uniref:chromosome segregation protein SMC n=1 Tax=Ruminococcus sp. TaxID=41978 RepID=UPI00300E731E